MDSCKHIDRARASGARIAYNTGVSFRAALLLAVLAASARASAAERSIPELIDLANKALRGNSSHGRLAMTVQTPDWTRTIEVEGWNKDRTMAFIVIRAPAKD